MDAIAGFFIGRPCKSRTDLSGLDLASIKLTGLNMESATPREAYLEKGTLAAGNMAGLDLSAAGWHRGDRCRVILTKKQRRAWILSPSVSHTCSATRTWESRC